MLIWEIRQLMETLREVNQYRSILSAPVQKWPFYVTIERIRRGVQTQTSQVCCIDGLVNVDQYYRILLSIGSDADTSIRASSVEWPIDIDRWHRFLGSKMAVQSGHHANTRANV